MSLLVVPANPLRGLRVLVAATASSTHLSGVPRHAANLARCLLTRAEIAEVHIVAAPWQAGALSSALPDDEPRLTLHLRDPGSNPFSRNLWYYRQLPLLAAKLGVDLVHLSYPVPLKRKAFACPVVVTLHDLYPYDIPENFGFPKVIFNRAILRQCLNEADAVTCVSETTLERLDVYLPGIALQKAATVYNCIERSSAAATTCPMPNWHGERFLLCVAQHRRNKNIILALQTFQRLLQTGDIAHNSRFVIVGIDGPESTRISRFVREAALTNRVVLLRGVADTELDWCYEHCDLLLATSSIEGFGLPVVEAMLHRCRIVCSNIPAFREVGGSYCEYADLSPDPLNAFVQAARSSLRKAKPDKTVIDRFSVVRVAEGYAALYTRLASEGVVQPNIALCSKNYQVLKEGNYEG